MWIEYAEWIDDQTFVCNFGQKIDEDGEWFELVGEYQKDQARFVFERIYDDCVLPVKKETTKMMMLVAMETAMRHQ